MDVQNAGPISKLGHDCRIVYSVISDIVSITRDLCTNRLVQTAGRTRRALSAIGLRLVYALATASLVNYTRIHGARWDEAKA